MELIARVAGVFVFITGVYTQVQVKTHFSCDGRPSGYYADVETGCQVYHMCDGLGRQFSYSCPNTTLFQQRMLICDHWYMVNCSKSEADYSANLLIGQRQKPFVEDSEKHPYHRTPRPDLLSQPKGREYDIIYRTGRAHIHTNLNLVGADTSHDENTATDKPTYFLPSHWSTEYPKTATPRSIKDNKAFGSNVKPYKVDKSPDENGKKVVIISGKGKINPSNLKPTVAPKPVTTTTEFPVNFKSNFKATTPNYPKTVGVTPPPISEDQLPPFLDPLESLNINSTFIDKLTKNPTGNRAPSKSPSIANNIKPPSIQYEPPPFSDDYINYRQDSQANFKSSTPENVLKEAVGANTIKTPSFDKDWKDLRRIFLIPDYEFPLDTASRPNYDQGLSSFQVDQYVRVGKQ